jgi:hypothetical protein
MSESEDSRSGAKHASATGFLIICLINGLCESEDSRSGAKHASATGFLIICLINGLWINGLC